MGSAVREELRLRRAGRGKRVPGRVSRRCRLRCRRDHQSHVERRRLLRRCRAQRRRRCRVRRPTARRVGGRLLDRSGAGLRCRPLERWHPQLSAGLRAVGTNRGRRSAGRHLGDRRVCAADGCLTAAHPRCGRHQPADRRWSRHDQHRQRRLQLAASCGADVRRCDRLFGRAGRDDHCNQRRPHRLDVDRVRRPRRGAVRRGGRRRPPMDGAHSLEPGGAARVHGPGCQFRDRGLSAGAPALQSGLGLDSCRAQLVAQPGTTGEGEAS